jgi:hypothetical protein
MADKPQQHKGEGPHVERPPKTVAAGHVEKPGERRLDDPREAIREALSGD